jgi:hypothetical protein
MIGSGMHKHVLKNHRCPLSDWETLLRATAERAGVMFGPWHATSLPVLWEQLVLEGVTRGIRGMNGKRVARSLRPNQVEHHLRRWVVKVLRECAAIHEAEFARHPIVAALSNFVRHREVHIIDLNFDDLLLTALKTERKEPTGRALLRHRYPGRVADRHNLFIHWRGPQFNRSCIWKPHGCVGQPESLRLGLRDYGLQSSVYAWAFDEYKAASKGDRDAKRGQRVMDTWIAKMMELECRIIGVGLSADEWGLQWLFMQRARNLSRRARSAPTTTLVESAGIMPIGVQVRVLPSWDDCWRAVAAGELVVTRK